VERREASVPRHGTQGASLGAWRAALRARPRVFRRAPERLSALRPPLDGVSEAKRQSPDAAMRARERDGLFDIVRFANARAVAPVWSFPRKREPRITGRWSWIPTLRPLCGRRPGRRGGAKEQPVAVGNDVWVGLPVSGLFFTGNCATATCRAVSRPAGQSRQAQIALRSIQANSSTAPGGGPPVVGEGRAVAARRCG
jgi:hypothetical protein